MRSSIPPEVIASWPKPNYIDPVTRGPGLYIVNGLFLFLATIAVGLRLYTRIFIRRWFGPDDVCVLIASICNISINVIIFHGNFYYGWGRHIWDSDPVYVASTSKSIFAFSILWITTSTLIRASLLLFYYRMVEHIQIQRYRWVLHCVVFFVLGILITFLGIIIFACLPIRAIWEFPYIPAKCINEKYALVSLGAFNTFSEFIIAILPIPVIMRLRMDPRQRWVVVSLLCLGFLVTVVGSVRIYYVWVALTANDPTWYSMPHWICSEVEIDTALVCACAPALWPVIGRLRKGIHLPKKPLASQTAQGKSGPNSHSFPGGSWDSEEKLNISGTQTRTLVYQSIDLEGIRNDGYGYTVRISAGPAKRDGTSTLKKRMKSRRKEGAESMVSRRPSRWFARWPLFSGLRSMPSDPSHSSRPSPDHTQGIEICERRSVDVRESFRMVDDGVRGWDFRNPSWQQLQENK